MSCCTVTVELDAIVEQHHGLQRLPTLTNLQAHGCSKMLRVKAALAPPFGVPGRSKRLLKLLLVASGLLEPLLGAPGAFVTPFRAPTRSHRGA